MGFNIEKLNEIAVPQNKEAIQARRIRRFKYLTKKTNVKNLYNMDKIYQVRLWCSDDGCEEFWFDKELSDFFYNLEAAENELKKYEGKTREEIEKMCDVVSVRSNRPRIETLKIN